MTIDEFKKEHNIVGKFGFRPSLNDTGRFSAWFGPDRKLSLVTKEGYDPTKPSFVYDNPAAPGISWIVSNNPGKPVAFEL